MLKKKKKEQNVEDLCKTLPVMAVYGDHVTDVVTTWTVAVWKRTVWTFFKNDYYFFL